MKINVIQLLQPRTVSNGEIRRLIHQGVVMVNGIVITSVDEEVDVFTGDKVHIGKHNEIDITEGYLKIVTQE